LGWEGCAPPESVRAALLALLDDRGSSYIPDEMAEAFNDATKAALALAFARFAEETQGPGAGE
jgi:hypothetical protein